MSPKMSLRWQEGPGQVPILFPFSRKDGDTSRIALIVSPKSWRWPARWSAALDKQHSEVAIAVLPRALFENRDSGRKEEMRSFCRVHLDDCGCRVCCQAAEVIARLAQGSYLEEMLGGCIAQSRRTETEEEKQQPGRADT